MIRCWILTSRFLPSFLEMMGEGPALHAPDGKTVAVPAELATWIAENKQARAIEAAAAREAEHRAAIAREERYVLTGLAGVVGRVGLGSPGPRTSIDKPCGGLLRISSKRAFRSASGAAATVTTASSMRQRSEKCRILSGPSSSR